MAHATNIVPNGIDPKAVRKWAAENGWTVKQRGRFSHALIAAYVAAQTPVVTVETIDGVPLSDMNVPF